MKKAVLYYLAGLLVALFAATDASAIPAFARQTGMACSACHYMHFPNLNSFGRAFKEGGYTMVGSQEKIEADDLSLPSNLNLALVGYVSYTKTNGTQDTTGQSGNKTTNDGQLLVPQQVSLFAGGRGGEHFGYEAEINLTPGSGGTIPDGTIGLIRFKVPFVYDVAGMKVGLVPFSTGLGVADSFEVLNTGAVAVHTFNQTDMAAVSAQQYIGTASAAHGVALIASNDNFFANVAKWGANQGAGQGAPSSNYVRAAWTPGDLIPGFDFALGFQSWSGSSRPDCIPALSISISAATSAGVNACVAPVNAAAYNSNGALAFSAGSLGVYDTKANAVDAQLMGDVAGMPLLVVASYADAPATGAAGATNDGTNLFNPGGTFKKDSFNVGAELGVIPNKATVQLALRHAHSGMDAGTVSTGTANGTNATDNAVMIGATYAVALNARLELTYSKYSGDMYGAGVAAQDATNGTTYMGDSLFSADLAFGF